MRLAKFIELQSGGLYRGEVSGNSFLTEEGAFNRSEVKLLPPVSPSKILCVGLNYADHAEETDSELPEKPAFFYKPPSSLLAPEEDILIDPSARCDYEAEVALIIKRRCRAVSPKQAEEYIWGYTCLNDVTNRDAQSWEGNWVRAKGFDTAAPMGPFLVTPDELDFPLSVQSRLNGETRQSSDTSNLIFGPAELVSRASSFMTLERGDVISTGTPAGIGSLSEGDRVEVEVSGVGVLRNGVREG